ncbi:putative lipid II flippase FtsW [Aeromicrobium sp. CFBP 8757]|uniref:putative lipid II flippase FtsW n=1 Tax=Aeromicrobium sp. CFBP 8757 TaxID=2775288 RepID=UPI00177E2EE8|nr:putative lipid II flippase FtsW [Aeromicrobium sp. CFBP 8757]MBD8608209.1 putative lipid II flippase FtsW [Aeromicrobium sp. CFBP 8757]
MRSTSEAIRRTLERPLASYQLVLGTSALLLGIGLIMVLSASSVFALVHYGNSFSIVLRQLIFAVLGITGAVVAARMPLSLIRRLILPFLLVSVALICATFIPGVGITVNGNRNWLPLFGGFQLQPSEFAKLALVLWIADLYARRQKYLSTPRYVLTPMVPVAGAVGMLVVLQRDLGTAVVIFALTVGMLWIAGLPRRQMGGIVAGLFVGLVVAVANSPHRVERLLNFTNPQADPDSAGYQAIKGMMALARGGFWGVGLGGSRQKWGSLPEAHTDFILAVIGEELGLLGTLVVLVLFIVLGFAGMRIAMRTREPFVRYAASGITIWLLIQAIINIGMVLGMLPVIGIPLPLISYGGSSLLVTLVSLGILLNCATTEPGAKRALAAGRANRKRAAAPHPVRVAGRR